MGGLVMIHYKYTSWQSTYPGKAVDLTDVAPGDDLDARVTAAVKLLDVGRRPKAQLLAGMREELREALVAVDDMESSYAAMLYPAPRRSADALWIEFTVFDNGTDHLTTADMIAGEVIDPANHEVITHGPADFALPYGPAVQLAQTTVTHSPDGRQVHHFPTLAICGQVDALDHLFVIRSYGSNGRLADSLRELVTGFAEALKFSGG
jgi:hypothetical protein